MPFFSRKEGEPRGTKIKLKKVPEKGIYVGLGEGSYVVVLPLPLDQDQIKVSPRKKEIVVEDIRRSVLAPNTKDGSIIVNRQSFTLKNRKTGIEEVIIFRARTSPLTKLTNFVRKLSKRSR